MNQYRTAGASGGKGEVGLKSSGAFDELGILQADAAKYIKGNRKSQQSKEWGRGKTERAHLEE